MHFSMNQCGIWGIVSIILIVNFYKEPHPSIFKLKFLIFLTDKVTNYLISRVVVEVYMQSLLIMNITMNLSNNKSENEFTETICFKS